ncbi:esterase YqiA [Vibrio sp. TH_r3]|uniref:esterase YqiA n=1 Tax=Vibrio sp. TH_r3 TaxID=3082084 RepID=UPI002952A693|nr:esterase YqiA [Vibrio sp. TH_r3]MDV7104533.1 esterase YqiA [Vibrio sp. TH_r3]
MKPSLLLYLHGFNSSPQSLKANQMRVYCEKYRPEIKVLTPQLPSLPEQAKTYLIELVEHYKSTYQIGLVGSSLGGYMSIWLNSLYGFSAVLINPAIKPYELLQDYLGEQTNPYTNEIYVLQQEHVEQLKSLEVDTVQQPSKFWLLQQKGDEVLDYHQAVNKFSEANLSCKAKLTVEDGGNHSFIGFERYPQQIVEFLKL